MSTIISPRLVSGPLPRPAAIFLCSRVWIKTNETAQCSGRVEPSSTLPIWAHRPSCCIAAGWKWSVNWTGCTPFMTLFRSDQKRPGISFQESWQSAIVLNRRIWTNCCSAWKHFAKMLQAMTSCWDWKIGFTMTNCRPWMILSTSLTGSVVLTWATGMIPDTPG